MNNQELLTIVASLTQEITEQNPLKGYTVTSTEVMDEAPLYKQLLKQLIQLETTTDYTVEQVEPIREIVEKMLLNIDEKAELLMRCDWLETMKAIETELTTITTLDAVKTAQRQLGRVQTCPLKNDLKAKLDEVEAQFETKNVLSSKEQLVEDIFATGNETFINLGSAGREYVLTEVLKETPSVELAIDKAVALEARVQSAKQVTSIEALETALTQLPLQHLTSLEEAHKTEVLELLLANNNWQSLFNLDLQIRNTANQVHRKHNPVQEGVLQTVMMDDKVMEQLGVQQL